MPSINNTCKKWTKALITFNKTSSIKNNPSEILIYDNQDTNNTKKLSILLSVINDITTDDKYIDELINNKDYTNIELYKSLQNLKSVLNAIIA